MDLRAWDASPENRQAATRLALRSAVGIYLVYLAWQLGAGALKGQGGVPAAAAFAAEVMGFLLDEPRVPLARSMTWTRLDTSRGQVLVRARG